MQAFPHLRVIGKQIDSPPSMKRSFNVQFEEIFAIDPPVSRLRNDSFVPLEHELNEKLSIRRSQQNCAYQLKNNDIEKCLRITSSGILQSHQQQQKPFSTTKKTVDQTATYVINPFNFGGRRKLTKIQEYKKYDFHSTTNHQQLKNNCELDDITFSAVSPRILNIKFLLSKPDEIGSASKPCSLKIKSATSKLLPTTYFNRMGVKNNKNDTLTSASSKSASLHKGKQPHVLQMPSLNYDFVVGRSISAVSKKRCK